MTQGFWPRWRADWVLLRLELAVGALALLLGGSLLYLVWGQRVDAYRQDEKARHALAAARSQLTQAQNEKSELQGNEADYRALVSRGVLADEKRLEWVEALKSVGQMAGRRRTSYEIQPQRLFEWGNSNGLFETRASRVKLHIEALHEGWLLDFFEQLAPKAPGFTVLRSCELQRSNQPMTREAGLPTVLPLIAECELDWLTLGRPVATEAGEGS